MGDPPSVDKDEFSPETRPAEVLLPERFTASATACSFGVTIAWNCNLSLCLQPLITSTLILKTAKYVNKLIMKI
ncbi:hypothetical protein PbDSM24746_40160 [Paenibacillus macerans]|nr:hypothetical protein PbDSM24746_40160 [Paenibacillus macerans]GBK70326.1 hypothetical protein PbJCM17693_40340 [Paenibacillus macerans]GIP13682.1 hypothetical protein J1TS5_58520 [Paenibacillus macerans]